MTSDSASNASITPPSDIETTKTIRGEKLLAAIHVGLEKILKETVNPGTLRIVSDCGTVAVICDTRPRTKRKRAKKATPPAASPSDSIGIGPTFQS